MNIFKTALITENEFTGKKRICKFDSFEIAHRVYRQINKKLYKITFIKCN